MKDTTSLSHIIWVISLIFSTYFLVLLSVIADLISGVRKAKKAGKMRTSKAFRRTVDKIARYFNALFALTVIDLMQMSAIYYLREAEGYCSLPLFPLITLVGAIGMALIELKSIYEKSEEKERKDYSDAIHSLASLLKDKDFNKFITNIKKP